MPTQHKSLTRRRPAIRSRGGFTLIELIVVLVITAVMAGVALPTLANLQSTRAAAAQRQIAADLITIRERAMATGTLHRAFFQPAKAECGYYTVAGSNPASNVETLIQLPGSGQAWLMRMNQGEFAGVSLLSVSIGSGTSVTFDWQGRPYDASGTLLSSNGTIMLTGQRTITIVRDVGLITTP